ncbi:MAG TPA: SigE family RNA polymerase sigma factor [Kineosporiaceae bacterium]|jgi:RNA polymerase sigma-70 factor (ECF subfamily)|nr:SigE family RNA polymerase sigma factor [Kineosporiaceae bacterium]
MTAPADEPPPAGGGDFDAFYRATAPRLAGQLLALTGDSATAEDLTQEAFVRAAAHWRRISRYDSPEAWVRRVAINLARSEVRRAGRHLAALRRHGPPPDVPPLGVEDLALLQALRELPHRFREVVVLHHLVGLGVDEIAVLLSTPAGTVRSRLTRGRRRLADLLAETHDALPAHSRTADGGLR